MKFEPTVIKDAYIITLSPHVDDRGAFARLYCENELKEIGHVKPVVQINQSVNKEAGTVRGMHFQRQPDSEIKMIRCMRGRVFDVAIDLREGSPSFLKWYAVELSADNFVMNYIPEGCAHGFQTLERDSELLYFHTNFYNKLNEGGVRFDDPVFSIDWPLPVRNITEKDLGYARIDSSFSGLKHH